MTTESGMAWYRVELDASGAIIGTPTLVESKGTATKLVCYVQASSLAEACQSAKEWHERRKAQSRKYDAVHRASQRVQGLCRRHGCVMPAEDGKTMCKTHLAQAGAYRRRRREGLTQPREKLTPAEVRERVLTRAKHASVSKGGSRGVSLRAALTQFDSLPASAFRAWLVSEIDRISAKACKTYNAKHGTDLQPKPAVEPPTAEVKILKVKASQIRAAKKRRAA